MLGSGCPERHSDSPRETPFPANGRLTINISSDPILRDQLLSNLQHHPVPCILRVLHQRKHHNRR